MAKVMRLSDEKNKMELKGTKFRQWTTSRLKEYTVKGFTMNDELLKEAGGGNYAEIQAMNKTPMYMSDWITRLVNF